MAMNSHGIIDPQENPKIIPSRQSVLIIDDSVDQLAVQQLVLEMDGFDVSTAQTGQEALNILSEQLQPQLILVDMQMDGMSGIEFLKRLEIEQPLVIQKVPVVFFTALSEVPESKAAGFIQKPVDNNSFINAVHGFLKMGSSPPYLN